eukprot:102773_1
MATTVEGTQLSGNDAELSQKEKKLKIQMLERGGDDMSSDMNKCLKLFLCFIAFCILYAFYVFFGLVWMTLMVTLGDDLNWSFFGIMVSFGGGMAGGDAYSMKSTQVGWC